MYSQLKGARTNPAKVIGGFARLLRRQQYIAVCIKRAVLCTVRRESKRLRAFSDALSSEVYLAASKRRMYQSCSNAAAAACKPTCRDSIQRSPGNYTAIAKHCHGVCEAMRPHQSDSMTYPLNAMGKSNLSGQQVFQVTQDVALIFYV